jgi:G:T-mismatch repair DNA endonuclease (very short patch repair protein)
MDNNNLVDMVVDLVVECPHCRDPILIEKLNCCIFRHGVFKTNGSQMDPHTPKNLCDYYVESRLIIGCGKPFKIIQNINSKNNDDKFVAIICDYI